MGKSSSSCFKLIVCGRDSAENDGYQELHNEIKDSSDKRGWSFRKRSERHRVLSNNVIIESSSSVNKESSECTSISCQPLADSNDVEKIYTTNIVDEKPQLSSLASTQISETIVTVSESKVDVNQPESVVIVIQAAIRGFLAQRALLKSKNVVKLQAAVRGHLVRRHAVGTLRCVQAIVKIQVLVRARRAQQSHSENHLKHKDGKNDCSKTLVTKHGVTKSNVTYTSLDKLLSNRFARQLLESTPRNKPIHVKCDPSKADSAWKWLERWMSVSSSDSVEYKKSISMSEQSDETKDITSFTESETDIPSEVFLQSADSKPTIADSSPPSEDEEKLIAYDAINFNFQSSPSKSSLVKDNLEQDPREKIIVNDAKVASDEIERLQNEKWESDAGLLEEPSSLPQKPEIDDEQSKLSTKRFALDQLENEGKKFEQGSRTLSNTAYFDALSKFEEPSSTANSGRSGSLSIQDVEVESQANTSSVATNVAYRSKEFSSENSALYPSRSGGSECGTEISITSTLDSPDRSEVGAVESEHDAQDFLEGIGNPEKKIDYGVKANILHVTSTSSLPNSDVDQPEIIDDVSGNMVHSVIVENSEECAVQSEKNAPDVLREQVDAVLQDFKLSPEASPISGRTITESQGTPSSQVSLKSKESKINKAGSGNKRRILSGGNKSPANANHDSDPRGSREQLPNDQSSGKRRNSFGSVKHDHTDQESRDNGSNDTSLPRFMQATQSARAKLNANNSPRSSPDVNDQDIYIKKRHSLPGADGKQGSPRIQQTPKVQQNSKGNSANALHERKWQR